MEYRNFGNLGFEVSRFGLGCMRLPLEVQPDGTFDESKIDEQKAIELIRYAIDNGVNYVDTANGYHGGNSKFVLGKALRDGYRDKVKLATKLPPWSIKEYADLERLLDEHLEALQTDHIDFYLLHSLNRANWDKLRDLGVLKFLDESVAKGKIRYPAFSFHDGLSVFKEIVDSYDWKMCQIQLNLLDVKQQAGVEGLKYAASKGIPVVIMEPLKGGRLATNIPKDVLAKWDESPIKRSPQSWAFHWLANFPEVTMMLSGSSTLDQLKDSLEIFKTTGPNTMSAEELKLVDEVRELYESKIKVGCTGCNYCMPCPNDVDIPGTFRKYNEAYIYENREQMEKAYAGQLAKGNGADKCIECGQCESVCPQAIEIIQKLKDAHSDLA